MPIAVGSALTPLVGREEELDLLLRRWSQTKDGEGQVVLLSGEPGIGKSRILSALRERLEAQGVQALRFQCSPYYVNSAFWPIIDNFERTLKFARDETTDAKLDKLEALVVTHYGRPLADVRFVARSCRSLARQRYGLSALTPQKHKDETLRTLVDLIEAAARQQPSVMLFEDAHWARPHHAGGVGSADRPGENRSRCWSCSPTGRSFSRAGPGRDMSAH